MTVYNPLNNYSVSTFTATETAGDSVMDQNMITSGELLIQPDDGYVVSASNFSVTNSSELTDPSNDNYANIDSITLTDTTTAGVIGNQVKVTVNLALNFSLDSNTTINLDIDGSAQEIIEENIDVSAEISYLTPDADTTITLVPNSGYTFNISVSGMYTNAIINATVPTNETISVGTLTLEANNNTYFSEQPFIENNNLSNGDVSLALIQTIASSPITKYVFNILFNFSRANNSDNHSGSIINLIYKKDTKLSSLTRTEILKVDHGKNTISNVGESRPIKIIGDPGAEFDISVTRASFDDVSIIDDKNSTKTRLTPKYGEAKVVSKKINPNTKGIQSFTFRQKFDANTPFTTTIDGAKTSTTITIDGDTSNIRVGDQLIYSDLATGTIVKVASITDANNVVLDTSVAQDDGDTVKFARNEEYHVNIYPKEGVTLASNIPIIEPHYRLYQYRNPKLVFTAATGTNYTTATYGAISYTGKANVLGHKLTTTQVPTGTGVTPISVDSFSVEWLFVRSGGTAFSFDAQPEWSSTITKDIDWDNNIASENGGTELEIFNIKSQDNGSGLAQIRFTVLIKKWGTEDVTLNLTTSNFLSVT